ncbi:glycoside hydrolase family 9 protein [Bacteroidota bacterium]
MIKKIFCFLLIINIYVMQAQVYVNQSGYKPDAPKYVLTDKNAAIFEILDKSTNQVILTDNFDDWVGNDPATGFSIKSGEFTELNIPGNYYIVTNLQDTSFDFYISDTAFKEVYYKSLKGFYYQRCGELLIGQHAGNYYHLKCHSVDAFYHPSTGLENMFNYAVGGWHDAGDYGKYIVNAGITASTLLLAYELFPERFSQDDLNIPESGNDVPDILDEVRHELEWFLRMQDSSGGVFAKLTAENFSIFIMPHLEKSKRYIYEISSAATADFAAVLAKAYRLFNEFDAEFADQCLDAAKNAWIYLENNPEIVPPGGFNNPEGTYTGVYGDGNDEDERLWAAIELYISTSEDKYLEYYSSNCVSVGYFNVMWWQDVRSLAHITFLQYAADQNDFLKDLLENSLVNLCEEIIEIRDGSGFRVALHNHEYVWGSNGVVLNKAVLLIFAYERFGEEKYLEAALDQFNYVLGTNAHHISFITDVGSKFPMNIHHRQSGADNIDIPVPGLIAGGPDGNLADGILKNLFDYSTPPGLCYVDDERSYASNEIAINWNAPLVFVSGYFNKAYSITGIKGEGNLILPEIFEIKQNYPNPFNGYTNFVFQLPEHNGVEFTIYDTLGREVFNKKISRNITGENNIRWAAVDNNGNKVNSGVYIYNIKGDKFSAARKMIYMK